MVKRLVQGVGINDANYQVQKAEMLEERYASGKLKTRKVWRCPYYSRWFSMLNRCYSKKRHERSPTYKGCTVCEEWLTFSNFRKWMDTQAWQHEVGEKPLELDKDLLFQDNKVYSPETCVFVHHKVNKFLTERKNDRGQYLLGCTTDTNSTKFKAQCNNPSTSTQEYLGLYDTEIEAHLVWKQRKHDNAIKLAHSKYVHDDRVRRILLTKYQNYKILEDHIV